MTYGSRQIQCSGYCSGWQPFRSTLASGGKLEGQDGCTAERHRYCWPAMRMMVKASTPDSPSLVNIVWRKECITKSAGKIGLRFAIHRWRTRIGVHVIQRCHEESLSLPVGQDKRAGARLRSISDTRSASGRIRRAFLLVPSLTRRKLKRAPLIGSSVTSAQSRFSASPILIPDSSINAAISCNCCGQASRYSCSCFRENTKSPCPLPR